MRPLQAHDPKSLGTYRLIGRLGEGGMGIVYLAQSERGAPVAIKTIRSTLLGDTDLRARFAREVHAAIRVTSPYTARVLDADLNADPPYLVTEYVAGDSLYTAVTSTGPLTRDALLGLAAGVAAALVAIHEADVVHRDLTPANVLLGPDGPRIIDLGIAQAKEETALTRTGTTVGTAGFLAPERLRGPATPASDIFSWGALLTFAATGRGPFGTGPADAIIYRTVHEEPDLAGVPDVLTAHLQAALAKAPDSRPSAAELVTALTGQTVLVAETAVPATAPLVQTASWPQASDGRLTEQLPAAAQPTDVAWTGQPAPKRRRIATALVAAGVLATAGVIAATALMDSDGAGPTDEEEQQAAATSSEDATTRSAPPSSSEDATEIGTPSSSPSPTGAFELQAPDPSSVELTAQLPDFHEEVHRTVAPRVDTADAVLIVSGPRSGEPRPLQVTLFEWDRDEYKIADTLNLDCGYLESPISDDEGPTVYIPCTGGASARWLYAIQPKELELAIFPDDVRDGTYTGWAFSAWERIPDPSGPDDLTFAINTCTPSCADGAYVDYLLRHDHGIGWWDVVECTYPDGESVPFGPINVTPTGYVPSVAPC